MTTFRYWCNKFISRQNESKIDSVIKSNSVNWFELSCQDEVIAAPDLPTEYVNTIRLQFRDLKMEFPAGTDGVAILQIAKGLMKGWALVMNWKISRYFCLPAALICANR